jgi:4-hydroxybenzoyl-CoA reductase subunit beta
MVAIGAKFRLVSSAGERIVDAAEFYKDDGIDYMNKRPDELLVDIHLPTTNGWRASYQKLRRRGAFDFPVLGVAAYVRFDGALPDAPATALNGSGVIVDAKIVLGGIAPSPVHVSESANALIGNPLGDDQIAAAAEAAYVKARPLDNTDFVNQWRKQMAREYTIRALEALR